MDIRDKAKNGQVLNAIKTYNEMTTEEKRKLQLGYDMKIEDYANFQVRYNKKGQLLGVRGHDFSERENAKLNEPHIDLVDSMQLLYGKKGSKAYDSAKKRVANVTHVSDRDIDAARKIVREK